MSELPGTCQHRACRPDPAVTVVLLDGKWRDRIHMPVLAKAGTTYRVRLCSTHARDFDWAEEAPFQQPGGR